VESVRDAVFGRDELGIAQIKKREIKVANSRSFCALVSILFLVLFLPAVASAQFKDLDAAASSLARGFGSGDPQPIVSGINGGDKVQLQFPGLMDQSGFFGRDQAAYLLDGLFNKVKPSGFKQRSAREVAAEGQYQISGKWTIQVNGKPKTVSLYITLRQKGNGWSLVSVRSA
jgi:hypothetical protein